jgi:hypothetical protein
LAFDVLQGFRTGSNHIWSISLQATRCQKHATNTSTITDVKQQEDRWFTFVRVEARYLVCNRPLVYLCRVELLIDDIPVKTARKKVHIETYGCAMNVSDSEIVASVMKESGYEPTFSDDDADVILINTCSIRENAEQKIWNRLRYFKSVKT